VINIKNIKFKMSKNEDGFDLAVESKVISREEPTDQFADSGMSTKASS
jgi:hypothetical protein